MAEVEPPSASGGGKDLVAVKTHEDSSSLNSGDAQTGVKGIEAISQTWTQWSLVAAYLGIFLLAFCTSLEGQTTSNLTVYATSAFAEHSLVATVLVVQQVVNAVIKPPMAKVANVFGRLEAFSFSVFLYVIGYIQMAGSKNVKAFASAQIFYSAGSTGLQILQQIFIADTTDLLNRALFSSLPDLPFLVTVWVGPPIANSLLAHSTWRWGYGLWTIVLPTAFLPLALALFLNMRKAARLHLLPPSPFKNGSVLLTLKSLWHELDIFGLLLLSAAISLILIPLTLAAGAKSGWHNASIIAMLIIGCLCLLLFPLWESFPKTAPHPFLSLRLFKNRTLLSGCTVGFFYFAVFYTSIQPYFSSYLQVVHSTSVTAAGHIVNTFSFTSTVTAILTSLLIKHTKRYKPYITLGASIYLLGIGLLIRYRAQSSSIAQIVGTQICIGIGGGMLNVPAQLGVQASVPHAHVAAATAIYLTLVEIGGAVGSAIAGAIWMSRLPRKLEEYLPPGSQSQAHLIFGNLTLAKSFPEGSLERAGVARAYQETMNSLLVVAVCFCVPVLLASFGMEGFALDGVDQRVRGRVIGGVVEGEGERVERVGIGGKTVGAERGREGEVDSERGRG